MFNWRTVVLFVDLMCAVTGPGGAWRLDLAPWQLSRVHRRATEV